MIALRTEVAQVIAPSLRKRVRKVRAPEGRVLGNPQASREDGKCHREQTADDGIEMASRELPTISDLHQARVKR